MSSVESIESRVQEMLKETSGKYNTIRLPFLKVLYPDILEDREILKNADNQYQYYLLCMIIPNQHILVEYNLAVLFLNKESELCMYDSDSYTLQQGSKCLIFNPESSSIVKAFSKDIIEKKLNECSKISTNFINSSNNPFLRPSPQFV